MCYDARHAARSYALGGMNRREFVGLVGGAPIAWSLPVWAEQSKMLASGSTSEQAATRIRAATGLRAALQSLTWIGAEAGLFHRHGLDVTLTIETGGPRAAIGTVRGDWKFCHTGDLPVVQGVLQGQDPVMILTPAELHDVAFLMGLRRITKPEHLTGARVGAVDATGQYGRAVEVMLHQWGVSASLVSLGSFQAIYKPHSDCRIGRPAISSNIGCKHLEELFPRLRSISWNIGSLRNS